MAQRPNFALYSSTLGNYFFGEIRRLLACGLKEWGARVVEKDQNGGFAPGADWHLIVGPQEFFYLGAGRRMRRADWPGSVVLYNAEQPASEMFLFFRRLLPRAHAVWDMDLETSRLWAREGWRSSHVPLGWTGKGDFFRPVNKIPPLPFTGSLDLKARPGFAGRPLDVLFAGSRVPRREAFFSSAASLLARHRSLVHFSDDDKFLRPRSPLARTKAMLGLAQRAKIVLNVHRQKTPFFEWHRIALHGIGQGALVVSEPTGGAFPFKAGRDFVEASLKEMPDAISHYLSSARGRREAAAIAAQGLTTYRRSCRLVDFMPGAAATLRSAETPAARRARLREKEATALLKRRSKV